MSKKLSAAIFSIGIFILFISYTFFFDTLLDRTWTMNFQTRDLARALSLLHGNPIFFGPETTNGASLPGPFFYILLLPAVIFQNYWIAAWWWMVSLCAASVAIASNYFSKTHGILSGLFFTSIFLLMPTVTTYFVINVNPSYLFIFIVISIIFALNAFDNDLEINRKKYFYIACLTIGLGIQLHFSTIFIFIAIFLMQLFAKNLNLPKHKTEVFLKGMLLIAALCAPYFIWATARKFGIQIGQQSSYSGIADEFNSTFIYLVKNALNTSFNQLMIAGAIDFLRTLPLSLIIFPFIFINLSENNWTQIKANKDFSDGWHRTKILLVIMAVCLTPYLLNIFIKLAHRYSLGLHIASLFLLTTLLFQISKLVFLVNRYIILCSTSLLIIISKALFEKDYVDYLPYLTINRSLLFAFGVIILIFFVRKLKISTQFAGSITAAIALTLVQGILVTDITKSTYLISAGSTRVVRKDWLDIFSRIYYQTGWSYSVAKDRIYLINPHDNNDLELIYSEVEKNLSNKDLSRANRISPDGILIAVGLSIKDINKWLLNEPIHEDIKNAIRHGHITFGSELTRKGTFPRIAVVPYYVTNTEFIPKNFHSNGLYYKKSEYFDLMKPKTSPETVYTSDNQEIVFQWNECPDLHPFCNSAAIVSMDKPKNSSIDVKVKIVGESLSQASVWIHPNWTAAWDKPYIEVKCDNKIHRKVIASSIGYKREYLKFDDFNFFSSNNSIIAPFTKEFKFSCKSKIDLVKVGRESSTIDYLTGKKLLPAKELAKILL